MRRRKSMKIKRNSLFEIGKKHIQSSQMNFGFLCKRLVSLPNGRHMVGDSRTQLHFVENTSLVFIRCFSSPKQYFFTVSYLINSCGLSPKTALSASKKIHFETPERPDSVLTLLRNHGCTNTHISKIVSLIPSLLLANPEKTLLPKLEFFRSVGFSEADVGSILSSSPILLQRSLENYLIPSYKFLKSVVMVNENVARAYKKSYWFSCGNLENIIVPNIAILRENGVPKSNILYLLTCHPSVVCRKVGKFSQSVKRVIEMGFDPLRCSFVKAVQVICEGTESSWEHRMEVYSRCGWTNNEIMLMFRQGPYIMKSSEKKIMSGIDFLVNRMGWQPAAIARFPTVFLLNLEKRTIPRCSVVKVLQMNGLVKKDLSLSAILACTERVFLDKFVVKYQEDIPQLFNVYKGKVDFLELDIRG